MAQQWEVVGGADKGGILVREGRELASPAVGERLATGSRVEQLASAGDRLNYNLISGSGPSTGWVSLKAGGKDLVVPVVPGSSGATTEAAEPRALPPSHVEGSLPVVGQGAGYRMRLAVNIDEWQPLGAHEGAEFQYLLGLIREDADREQVLRFRLPEDKKRALIARLLIRAAAASALDHDSFEALTIKRTKGRKPFLASPLPPENEAPNWNVNISHDGSWVVCASEPVCVAGIDVADVCRVDRRGRPLDSFRKDFGPQLTPAEWRVVDQAGQNLDAQYEVFSRMWAAKEAFVKARGDGLGAFERLSAAEFTEWVPVAGFPANTAYEGTVAVEGKPQPLWRFVQHRMPGDKPHWTTVARGPLSAVVDANGEFKATLRNWDEEKSGARWQEALQFPSPACAVVPVAALVPAAAIDGYVRAGGTRWK